MNEELEELLLKRDVVHCILHRMTPWQYFTRGRWWTKKYDEFSVRIALLQKGESNEPDK